MSAKKGGSSKGAPLKISVPVAPTRIKIISIGAGGCGKSCLIKRYCEERFVTKYIATIGVDYGVKPVNIDGTDIRVNFWDLSGHSEFFEVRNEFYKDAQGILLVYDVSSRASFEECDNWLTEASKYGADPATTPCVLCGNKTDKRRQVEEQEGVQYASSRGMTYIETSAASGERVEDMFNSLFAKVLQTVKK
jgi:DnaJ family protein C protein 27